MTTVHVMIDVDLDDVSDVISYRRGAASGCRPFTAGALARYDQLDTPGRNELLGKLPPSLAWCIDEAEREGLAALERIIAEYGPDEPRFAAAT